MTTTTAPLQISISFEGEFKPGSLTELTDGPFLLYRRLENGRNGGRVGIIDSRADAEALETIVNQHAQMKRCLELIRSSAEFDESLQGDNPNRTTFDFKRCIKLIDQAMAAPARS